MGQFADDGTFVINEHTGEIFATRPLDRDWHTLWPLSDLGRIFLTDPPHSDLF